MDLMMEAKKAREQATKKKPTEEELEKLNAKLRAQTESIRAQTSELAEFIMRLPVMKK